MSGGQGLWGALINDAIQSVFILLEYTDIK